MYYHAFLFALQTLTARAFCLHQQVRSNVVAPTFSRSRWSAPLSSTTGVETDETDEAAIQWELLQKYHAKGSWKGVWTTYDYVSEFTTTPTVL